MSVAAMGFYGDYVQIGHGSKGGWDKSGPERLVTRSEGNVLHELDGKPALKLYREYLGDKAKDFPSRSSLTFAGDIPKGYLAQLMKADFDRLIGGAASATTMAKATGTPVGKHTLVVAIACVGRREVSPENLGGA